MKLETWKAGDKTGRRIVRGRRDGDGGKGRGEGGGALVVMRLARPDDAAALAAMNLAFNRVRRSARQVRASLGRSPEIVAVAEVDGKLVGFACAHINDSFCYDHPWAELAELYVEAKHRSRGYGTRLLRFVERALVQRGVTHIHILTGKTNRRAQMLYKALGYTPQAEVLLDRDLRRARPGRRPITRDLRSGSPDP